MPILKYVFLCNLLLFQVFSGFSQQNDPLIENILQNSGELLDSLGISDSVIFHPEQREIFTDSIGAGLKSLFNNEEITEVDTLKSDSIPNVPVAKRDVETTIDYQARDSIFFDLESQEMFLFGEAKINYGAIELEAERIDINWIENTLKANYVEDTVGKKIGKPVFTEAGEKYVTDDMTYNFQTRKAIINGIITEQDGAFMHGERVKKNEKDELFVNEARYTTCNLAEPHFHISSKKLKVIPKNKVVSGPFNLHFKNIPTPLGFFFGMFPQPRKEQSGVVVPSWGEDPTRGFFLRDGGYYFSISDYIDLRLTGEVYSRGNYGLRAQSSYSKRYRYSGNFNMRYNKSVGNELDNPAVSKDFWVNWSHSPQPRGTSRFSASVSAGTSSYNQNVNQVSRDFTRSISAQFQSNVSFTKTFQGTPFNMTLNLRHNQNVQTGSVSLTFPELALNANRVYPFKNSTKLSKSILGKLGFSYNMVAKNDLNNNPVGTGGLSNIINRSALDGEMVAFNTENLSILLDRAKIGMRHTIPITTSFKALKYFSVTPSFNYTEVWYPKELRYSYDQEEQGVRVDTLRGFSRAGFYNTGANMNTTIYGTYFFKGKKIQAIRHVMIPSIGFSYSPDFSDPRRGNYQEVQVSENEDDTRLLSKFNGFAYGGPGTGRSASMNFSLTNNIEMKVRTKNDSTEEFKKVKLFDNLSFSTGYNFLADSLKLSPIAIRAKTTLFNRAVSLGFSGNIDPYIYVLDSVEERSGGSSIFHQTQIDKLAWNSGKGLGQLSSGTVTLVINLRPKSNRGRGGNADQNSTDNDPFGGNQDPLNDVNDPFNQNPNNDPASRLGSIPGSTDYDPNRYVDFDIPWNLGINYSLNYRKTGFADSRITQTLGFNGNVSITNKTKISFNSGYDLENKEFTVTRLNLTRDLHCWNLTFSWVPFGPRQEYFVEVRVLSTLLKDLKLDKKRRQQFTTF